MSNVEINAEVRSAQGKGMARKLRSAGKVPGVLYSADQESTPLSLDPGDLDKLRREPLGFNTPIQLIVDGLAGKHLAMIKEMQRHPVSRQLIHVDFLQIDETQTIIVDLPVQAVGVAKGMEFGGMLNLMRRKIQVRCLAANIPESIEIDITDLDVGDKVYSDVITLPEGVEALSDQRYAVLAISVKGAIEEEEEEEEAVEGEEGEEGEEGAEEASDGAADE